MSQKMPRAHAADILALPTTDREAALEDVPEHVRETVRHHVRDQVQKIEALAGYVARLETKDARAKAIERIPSGVRDAVKTLVIEIFKNKRSQ